MALTFSGVSYNEYFGIYIGVPYLIGEAVMAGIFPVRSAQTAGNQSESKQDVQESGREVPENPKP